MIEFYTDGSSRGNPGQGGFGAVLVKDGIATCLFRGTAAYTTNNEQELMAILAALDYMKENYPDEQYTIYTDSMYCVNSINNWMCSWAYNGWIKGNGEPVKNAHIIKPIYAHTQDIPYNWYLYHIKGHAGAVWNEVADALATGNREKFTSLLNENNENFSEKLIILTYA